MPTGLRFRLGTQVNKDHTTSIGLLRKWAPSGIHQDLNNLGPVWHLATDELSTRNVPDSPLLPIMVPLETATSLASEMTTLKIPDTGN